ncbi:MAG: LON peptidase substrate-binding domain-containing protein [Limisphaerales bacterium]
MKVPAEVPGMILPETTLFPGMTLPLRIFEPRYRQMLADVLEGGRMFAVALRNPKAKGETPMSIGGLGLVSTAVRQLDGTSLLTLEGLARIEFIRTVRLKPYRVEAIRALASPPAEEGTDAIARKVRALVRKRVKAGFDLGLPTPDDPEKAKQMQQMQALANASFEQFGKHLSRVKSPEQLADLVASTLIGDPLARQMLLATPQVDERLRRLHQLLLVTDFPASPPES